MPAVRTPRETVTELHQRISASRWDELAELYAEDTVVDIVFAKPVAGHAEGRESLAEHFAPLVAGGLQLKIENTVLHETADPEVVIAEYESVVTVAGNSVRAANVQVVRVRDGLIATSRDYHDHVAIAAASGRLDEMLAGVKAAA